MIKIGKKLFSVSLTIFKCFELPICIWREPSLRAEKLIRESLSQFSFFYSCLLLLKKAWLHNRFKMFHLLSEVYTELMFGRYQ